jgi:hypothetical protein
VADVCSDREKKERSVGLLLLRLDLAVKRKHAVTQSKTGEGAV